MTNNNTNNGRNKNGAESEITYLRSYVPVSYQDTYQRLSIREKLLGSLLMFAVVLFGTFGLIYSISTSFQFDVGVGYIFLWSSIAAIFFTALYLIPSRMITALVLILIGAAGSVLILQNIADISEALNYILHSTVYKLVNNGYSISFSLDLRLVEAYAGNASQYQQLFISLLSFPMGLLISYLVYSRMNVLWLLFATVAILFPGFFYGMIPSYFAFSLVVSMWIAVFCMNVFNRHALLEKIERTNNIPVKRLAELEKMQDKKRKADRIKQLKKQIRKLKRDIKLVDHTEQIKELSETLMSLTKKAKLTKAEKKAAKADKKREKHTEKEKIPFGKRMKDSFDLRVHDNVTDGFHSIAAFIIAMSVLMLVSFVLPEKAVLHIPLPNVILDNMRDTINYSLAGSNTSVYGSYSGGMSGGQLYSVNGVSFSNKKLFKVNSFKSNTIYLKGWTGSVYTGRMWLESDKEQDNLFTSLVEPSFVETSQLTTFYKNMQKMQNTPFNQSSAEINEETITINHLVSGGRSAFIPYFMQDFSDLAQYKSEVDADKGIALNRSFMQMLSYKIQVATPGFFLRRDTLVMGLINDTIENYADMFPDGTSVTSDPKLSPMFDSYTSAGGTGMFEDMKFIAAELKYRAFVNDIYTRLPDEFPDDVKQLAADITKDTDTDYYKAVAIEQYLATNYEYTLNPKAPMDVEKDFVYSFLFDTKEGYCTYYATTMVTMMRSLGIPARYVEGFAVDNTRNVGRTPTTRNPALTTVYDYNAHAWAEVYFPGIGWLPFEPTTATQVEQTAPQEPSYQPPVRLPVSESTHMPTLPPEETGTDKTVDNIQFNPGYIAFFAVLSIFLVVYYTFKLVNFIINKKRISRFLRSAPNIAVRLMLNYTLKLLSYCGYDMTNDEGLASFALRVLDKSEFMINTHFDRIAGLMQKARFSSTPLTEEERGEVYSFIRMMRHNLYRNSNLRDRLKLKYLWVIL